MTDVRQLLWKSSSMKSHDDAADKLSVTMRMIIMITLKNMMTNVVNMSTGLGIMQKVQS